VSERRTRAPQRPRLYAGVMAAAFAVAAFCIVFAARLGGG
jgi:hypothetical protein